MNNDIEIGGGPVSALLALLNFVSVSMFKDTVAGDMVPLSANVLGNTSQDIPVHDAGALEQRREVVRTEVSIWAAVAFATTRRVLSQYFLTRKGRITPATPIGVAPNITIRMPDVVAVLFVECVIGDFVKRLSPEDDAVFHS